MKNSNYNQLERERKRERARNWVVSCRGVEGGGRLAANITRVFSEKTMTIRFVDVLLVTIVIIIDA